MKTAREKAAYVLVRTLNSYELETLVAELLEQQKSVEIVAHSLRRYDHGDLIDELSKSFVTP